MPVSYVAGRDSPLFASALRNAPYVVFIHPTPVRFPELTRLCAARYVMMAAWAAVIVRLLVRTSNAASSAGGIAGGLLSFGRMKGKKVRDAFFCSNRLFRHLTAFLLPPRCIYLIIYF